MVLILFLCVLKRCVCGLGSLLCLGSPCFSVRVGRFPVFLLRLCAVSGGLLCFLFLLLPVLLLLGVLFGSALALAFLSRLFARSRGVRLSWSLRWGRGWWLALPFLRVARLARCLLGLSVAARFPSLGAGLAGSGCLALCRVMLCRPSSTAFACRGPAMCLCPLVSSGVGIPPSGAVALASLNSSSRLALAAFGWRGSFFFFVGQSRPTVSRRLLCNI